MKVDELKGVLLDHWVARAKGLNAYTIPGSLNQELVLNDESVEFGLSTYQPTKDWSIAGPLLASERVSLMWTDSEWKASKSTGNGTVAYYDASPLVAAMRCIVGSKFGKEVAHEDDRRAVTSPPLGVLIMWKGAFTTPGPAITERSAGRSIKTAAIEMVNVRRLSAAIALVSKSM